MCSIFSNIPREAYTSETRSVRLGGHATSIRLERAYWTVLERLAAAEGMPLGKLLTELHDEVLQLHGEVGNFSSMLRCVCLMHLQRTQGEGTRDEGFRVDPPPETNMVMFQVEDAAAFRRALRARDVWIEPMDPRRFRAVTHLDVSAQDLEDALARIGEVVAEGIR